MSSDVGRTPDVSASGENAWGRRLEAPSGFLLRYGLVILLWVGGLKFTAYEAEGIQVLVENSPLLSWLYDIFNVRTFSTCSVSSRSRSR